MMIHLHKSIMMHLHTVNSYDIHQKALIFVRYECLSLWLDINLLN